MQDRFKKTRNPRSLTVTLALAFFALSAVILSTSGSLNIYFRMQNQQKVIDNQQQLVAQEAADDVMDFFSEKYNTMEEGVRLGDLGVATEDEQRLVLEKLIGFEPAFRQLVLMNEQGQELVKVSRLSTYAAIQSTGVKVGELFLKASEDNRSISSVYIDNITCEPLVIMAVSVTDGFGDLKGVLMSEVNLKFMWDLVDSIKVGETGAVYVVDRDGNLIACCDTCRVLRRENLAYLDEVKEFIRGNSSDHEQECEISKGITGEDVVTTHVHLVNPDWAVVVELPVDEAYEDVNRELRLSLFVMFLCFVLAIAIGIYLSRRITKPIKELRDATREVSKGNLDTEIEIKSRSEIGDLAISFNLMTRDLKKSKRKLEDYSRTLEENVKERTSELMTANQALKSEIAERKKAEEALKRTMYNLERFNRLAVGRELQMIELKREVNDLLHSMGSQEKYRIQTQSNQ